MIAARVLMIRTLIVATVLVAFGAGVNFAREPDAQSKVESQQLFVQPFAGDPSKEINAQGYTFQPGAVLPWHIHPDAEEIAYVIEGIFTFERAGEAPMVLKPGDADYVAPNVVHRGMNLGTEPVKLFVVRIKPKDKPLVQEVPAPTQP
jgi:quercetin dioxygenase-like cupin family protein